MNFSLLPQKPCSHQPEPSIGENSHKYSLFLTFRVATASKQQIFRSIQQFRCKFQQISVVAFSKELYQLLASDNLAIYDFPKSICNSQADILIYIFSDNQAVDFLQSEVANIFRHSAHLESVECGEQFLTSHLDILGCRYYGDKQQNGPLFDEDMNSYCCYQQFYRSGDILFTEEEEEQHLESFQKPVVTHDYPCYTANSEFHCCISFSDKLINFEENIRYQQGLINTDYHDPYDKAYTLIEAGFYVAPNAELFLQVYRQLQGTIDNYDQIDVLAGNQQKVKKFRIAGDEAEEEDEEEPEEEEFAKEEEKEEAEHGLEERPET